MHAQRKKVTVNLTCLSAKQVDCRLNFRKRAFETRRLVWNPEVFLVHLKHFLDEGF